MKLLLLLALSFLAISCQTNMARQFDKINAGADKDKVLNLMGNPRHITRMDGEDRWYYLYYQDEARQQKEVHFRNGLVVYAGEKKKPTPDTDPVAVDAKNEKLTEQIEAEAEKRKQDSKNAYTNYIKYQKKMKKEDEVQYLPDFEPLD